MSEQPITPARTIRLGQGQVANLVLTPVRLTTLQVPATVSRERVTSRTTTRTRVEAMPRLVGKAALPAGTSGGASPGVPSGSVGSGLTYYVRQPLMTWRFSHPLGRRPQVTVFYGLDDDAQEADTDVYPTALDVVVEWAVPTVGSVMLR